MLLGTRCRRVRLKLWVGHLEERLDGPVVAAPDRLKNHLDHTDVHGRENRLELGDLGVGMGLNRRCGLWGGGCCH